LHKLVPVVRLRQTNMRMARLHRAVLLVVYDPGFIRLLDLVYFRTTGVCDYGRLLIFHI